MLFLLFLLFASAAGDKGFELNGRLQPPSAAAVQIYAATSPFSSSTLAGVDGRFRFNGILAGAYTLSVTTTGREWRQTIDVGPGTADEKSRVNITVPMFQTLTGPRAGTISARELSIPKSAWKAYHQAQDRLSKHDTGGAIERLNQATEIAPRFSAAWNNLGTIAYHRAQFKQAEQYFRKALEAAPDDYAPLVNLGGVLLDLGQFREAWNFNLLAVMKQPGDALAHSQLGIACFRLGKLGPAEEHLQEAIRLDPGHFSNPQLILAEVYVRQQQPRKAAEALEDFVARHPDSPLLGGVRKAIARLRADANAE